MKRILIFLIAFLLCGCSNVNKGNINEALENALLNDSTYLKLRANNSGVYYSYYLPSDLVEDKYENDNCYLVMGDTTILMNLNISGIISETYYGDKVFEDEGLFDESKLIFKKDGYLIGSDSLSVPYLYRLYQYDDYCYAQLKTADINIYSRSSLQDAASALKHMLILAKGVRVNRELVVDEYSSKNVIEYKKNTINLFEYTVPTNGVLEDLNANVSNQDKEEISNAYDGGMIEPTDEQTAEDVD